MLKGCTNKLKRYRCERIKNRKCERAVEEGKMFFLRQCITQRIKAGEDTEMTGKRKENIRSLTMQHTMSAEYHRSKKVKLSHKLI